MKITLAQKYGMCFGVRDALRTTHDLAASKKVTVLGQLVHNPIVSQHLKSLDVQTADLSDTNSVPSPAPKPSGKGAIESSIMLVTAHGASDKDRAAWQNAGHTLADTTCPLVRKAHNALAQLVAAGYHPVVIGKAGHVEVRGLTGDFPRAHVILAEEDVAALPFREKIGVISQTTQPLANVETLVDRIRARHPDAEVRFIDTVCQPTKDRQTALEKLCRENDLVIVVGGHNSNNTAQLVATARKLGTTAHHVATPDELDPRWFKKIATVGITAGTSTLDDTVFAVRSRIQQIAANQESSLFSRLTSKPKTPAPDSQLRTTD